MGVWNASDLKALNAAVFTGDGSIVDLLRGRMPEEVLQLAGEGLLDAVRGGVQGASEPAAECAAALRQRDWIGDEELADQLEAALNRRPAPMLRSTPVDLEHVASLLEGDPRWGGGRIDLNTGQCWPADSGYDDDDDLDDAEDDDRWLYVGCEGSGASYRDMELFIATVDDPAIVGRLEIAIRGKGAFRRFKDVLSRWPDELQRYFLLSSERQRGRARAFLAEAGYRPSGASNVRQSGAT